MDNKSIPERIYLPFSMLQYTWASTRSDDPSVEYVRADLALQSAIKIVEAKRDQILPTTRDKHYAIVESLFSAILSALNRAADPSPTDNNSVT